MKAAVIISMGLLAGGVFGAEEPVHRVSDDAARLIRQDAERVRQREEGRAKEQPAASESGVVVMKPYIVSTEKLPELPPPAPPENGVQKMLRTGTIAEHIGPTFTRRLWAQGNKGVMLSFCW